MIENSSLKNDELIKYMTKPSYHDLLTGVYAGLKWYYSPQMTRNYSFPYDFLIDIHRHFHLGFADLLNIVSFSFVFILTQSAFKPYLALKLESKNIHFEQKSNQIKLCDCVWKLSCYLILWIYSFYLLFLSGKYPYFNHPDKLWKDWSLDLKVHSDTKLFYYLEAGFYFHLIYSSFKTGRKRKEFLIMLFHDLIALTLILLSFCFRYHQFGLLVLFLHDINDIILEFTKSRIYLARQIDRNRQPHELYIDTGFIVFLLSWFITRLYWFPLKVIYTTSVTSMSLGYHRGASFYLLFNSLLAFLLALNIYWFILIALIVGKRLIGKVSFHTNEYGRLINQL